MIKKYLENPEAFAPKPVEPTNAESAAVQPAKAESGPDDIIPGQQLASLRKIPAQTRLLYGGIAIAVLVLLVVTLRLLRRRTG